jgi:hypothetical protein
MKFVTIGIAILAVLAGAGVLWVADAHVMPPTQKIEQTIPDDRIPH